jgi:uracil-DNA glycosylase
VVTLGRHSLGRFMPGTRISQSHGTVRPVDPATGAGNALVFAMYHPAAALRTPEIERQSYDDVASIPAALLDSRARRGESTPAPSTQAPPGLTGAPTQLSPNQVPGEPRLAIAGAAPDAAPDATLF